MLKSLRTLTLNDPKKIEDLHSSIFLVSQKEQIKWGLEDNLDVFIYAKPEYDRSQMRELRFGLKDNLDVSVYAKKDFYSLQMQEIRAGLENNLDVSIYLKKDFNYIQMREIRWLLAKNKFKAFIYAKLIYYSNKIKLKLSKESTLL